MDLIYKEESYRIMGACFEVYKDKGSGFVEPVYQECLSLELGFSYIPFIEQPDIKLTYKGRPLRQIYKPDFICSGAIIVEIKAVSRLADEHRAGSQLSQGHRVRTWFARQLRALPKSRI